MPNVVVPGFYCLAGIMAYAAVYHFSVGGRSTRERVHLLFSGMCLAIMLMAYFGAQTLQATGIGEAVWDLKGGLAAVAVFFILFPWFIALYTGKRPLPLLVGLSLLFVVMLVANLIEPYSVQFDRIDGLHHLHLPWGEVVTRVQGHHGFWLYFSVASVASAFGFALVAVGGEYRRHRRRTDLAILLAIGIFLLTAIQGALVRLGVSDSVGLGSFGFLVLVLVMSISLTHETQQRLRTSERHFRSLFENSPAGVVAVDPASGRVVQANPLALKMSGYSAEEILTKTVADLTMPEDMEDSRQRLAQLTGGMVDLMHYERRYRRKDGSSFMADHSVSTLKDENGKVVRLITSATDITQRKRAEEALRQNEEKFRTIFQNSPLGIFRSTPDGRFLEVNPAMARINGFDSPEDMVREVHDIGKQVYVNPDDRQKIIGRLLGSPEGIIHYHNPQRRKDGGEYPASVTLKIVRDADGKPMYIDGIVEDITERMHAEQEREDLQQQLQQIQKMDSIGRLAGGVAHDFNNMLAVIIGYAELAQRQLSPEDQKLSGHLREIRGAAERSADLTRQLLAFARKETVVPKVLDLNASVDGMLKMLQRMISENIELGWLQGEGLWPINADPTQIDQILANLCVNARDAIAGVGKITIETHNETLDADYCSHHPAAMPGDYVRLSVGDDGCGMDAQTIKQIFEPFFTTKAMGMGTGLGLSTVYGIVEQNKGFIDVDSEPGRGTVFNIYLPRHMEGSEQVDMAAGDVAMFARGNEGILLVEDEAAILEVAKLVLGECGYRVLAVHSPDEAIRIAKEQAGEIQLLVTDMIMPGMSGRDLAENLLSVYPQMKCLYMSGYLGDAITHQGVLDEGVNFIQKPFSPTDLAIRVRQVLDD